MCIGLLTTSYVIYDWATPSHQKEVLTTRRFVHHLACSLCARKAVSCSYTQEEYSLHSLDCTR